MSRNTVTTITFNRVPSSINHIDRDLYGASKSSAFMASFLEQIEYLKLWREYTLDHIKKLNLPDYTNKVIEVKFKLYFKVDRNRDYDNYFAVLQAIIDAIPTVSKAKYIYFAEPEISKSSKPKLVIEIQHIRKLTKQNFDFEVFEIEETPTVDDLEKGSISKLKRHWLSLSHSLVNTIPNLSDYILEGTIVKLRFFLSGEEKNFNFVWYVAMKKIIDGIFETDDYKNLLQLFPDFAIDKKNPRVEILLKNDKVRSHLTNSPSLPKDYKGRWDKSSEEILINWLAFPKFLKGTMQVTPGHEYLQCRTFDEFATYLDVSRATIYNNLTEDVLIESRKRSELFFKSNVTDVWGAVLKNAMGDSFMDRKMFLEKYDNFIEKSEVDHKTDGEALPFNPSLLVTMTYEDLLKASSEQTKQHLEKTHEDKRTSKKL